MQLLHKIDFLKEKQLLDSVPKGDSHLSKLCSDLCVAQEYGFRLRDLLELGNIVGVTELPVWGDD